jgi:hypothetical protein
VLLLELGGRWPLVPMETRGLNVKRRRGCIYTVSKNTRTHSHKAATDPETRRRGDAETNAANIPAHTCCIAACLCLCVAGPFVYLRAHATFPAYRYAAHVACTHAGRHAARSCTSPAPPLLGAVACTSALAVMQRMHADLQPRVQTYVGECACGHIHMRLRPRAHVRLCDRARSQ